MRIIVATVDGSSHTLEIDESDIVSTIHTKYEDASAAESGSYFFTYGGKQLTDTDVIASLDIREGATLHAVPEITPSQAVPTPCLFPGREEVKQQIKKWEEVARRGNFDADMHILDPVSHHAWLEFLEKDIIENSEFFNCRGYYDLSDHDIPAQSSSSLAYREVPDFMKALLVSEYGESFSEVDNMRESWRAFVSLRKTYVIMSRVLAGFRHLHRAGFCGSAFNVLLLQPDRDIAKVVRIPEILLAEVQQGVQEALVQVSDLDLLPDEVYVQLLAHIEPPLYRLLEVLGHRHSPNAARSGDSILELCRLTSIFVDLGLVSYVGSHGQRFDLDYLENDLPSITVTSGHAQSFSFDCRRSRLACLDEFLDKREVWTFSSCTEQQAPIRQQMQNTERLMILTSIEDFADIWGPVWAVASDQGVPNVIQYYQLTRGVIYPEDLGRGSQHEGSVRCHWTTSSDFERRRGTSLLQGESWGSLATNELLLIGATFRENSNCHYTLNDFENAYGHTMSTLGPRGPKLTLETLSGGLSISKIVGLSGQATAKISPRITLKEWHLTKWKLEPDAASPYIFHMPFAVEVSHCTGNARRTQLRNLFLMAPVQLLLERICPHWSRKPWGSQFLQALNSHNPDDMNKVWCDNQKKRRDIAKMITPVLEILAQTGNTGDEFNVGFFNSHQERYLTFQCRLNDWARVLKDTRDTAVYAIISDKCLEAYTYTHNTARCDGHDAFTVLHTHLASKTSLSTAGFIDINASGHYYCEDKDQSGSKIKVMTPIPHSVTPFASMRNIFQRKNVNETAPLPKPAPAYEVFLRASKVSSGGMAHPRLRRWSLTDVRNFDLSSLPLENGSFTWSQRSH